MRAPMDSPILIFVSSLALLWIATRLGASVRKRRGVIAEEARENLGIVLAASLTLLALVVGFTFSMALGRYDLRKSYEEAEANAIGTEYVRADLLPSADGGRVRALLRDYLDYRILYYEVRDPGRFRQIDTQTAQLQTELWSAILPPAANQPTQIVALAVSGMNDVLNAQGYAQAAWWNRIPSAAWALLGTIAFCCNLLVGYCARSSDAVAVRHLALPFVLAVALALIADIEAPRGGVILVGAENLSALRASLHAQ
jgi:hypothetical protein